jgi:hypothetical protein
LCLILCILILCNCVLRVLGKGKVLAFQFKLLFFIFLLQAKILYKDGFTKEEVASFKFLIQANIYKYMAILLEGRERFEDEEDDFVEASVSNFGESTSSIAPAGMMFMIPGCFGIDVLGLCAMAVLL